MPVSGWKPTRTKPSSMMMLRTKGTTVLRHSPLLLFHTHHSAALFDRIDTVYGHRPVCASTIVGPHEKTLSMRLVLSSCELEDPVDFVIPKLFPSCWYTGSFHCISCRENARCPINTESLYRDTLHYRLGQRQTNVTLALLHLPHLPRPQIWLVIIWPQLRQRYLYFVIGSLRGIL